MSTQRESRELRIAPRFRVTGHFPGRLVALTPEGGRDDLFCAPINVSRLGLGVRMSAKLESGAAIELVIDQVRVALRVVWRRDLPERGQFRYGLRADDETVDLEELFFSVGSLVEDYELTEREVSDLDSP